MGVNWKSSQWPKLKQFEKNKVVLGYKPKYKINIHVSIADINKWFNKEINGGEQTNFPCRRLPNNLCGYSTLKKWSITPQSFSANCTWWLPSKAYSMEKGEMSNLTVEKQTLPQPGDQGQHQQWCHDDSKYPWYDVMRMILYLCSPPPQNP